MHQPALAHASNHMQNIAVECCSILRFEQKSITTWNHAAADQCVIHKQAVRHCSPANAPHTMANSTNAGRTYYAKKLWQDQYLGTAVADSILHKRVVVVRCERAQQSIGLNHANRPPATCIADCKAWTHHNMPSSSAMTHYGAAHEWQTAAAMQCLSAVTTATAV